MAIMIPPYIDNKCKSLGEKLLFNIFKNSNFTKDWIILHSLNLASHSKRLYGEIDFLLLIPKGGIYVLEVKGGDVKCLEGIWYFTNRYNETFTSNLGPFNQARDAMFSLRNAIRTRYGRNHKFNNIICGFLCAFPNVVFNKDSVEYDEWQIIDKDKIDIGLEGFFSNLIQKYTEKFSLQPWFTKTKSLPEKEDLEELTDYLRGDFERLRTLSEKVDEFNKQVYFYTKEQYRVLDHIQLNKRNLIQGSAGTGKTNIAMESAVRAAKKGERVLLTCFNRLIGDWMKTQLADYKEMIKVGNLHQFMREEARGLIPREITEDTDIFFTEYLPEILCERYKIKVDRKFDKIIIDEGQDLIRESYLGLFDCMLKGGMSEGRWEIYGDFERQAIYGSFTKAEMFQMLEQYSVPTNFLLTTNCRNSRQIGEETSMITGFERPQFLIDELNSIPVEYYFYSNDIHQCELIAGILEKLSKAGINNEKLIILSPSRYENSSVANYKDIQIVTVKPQMDNTAEGYYIRFSTIHYFKGMEADYVIIADIDDLDEFHSKSLLYVGMSRAKYGLIILMKENVKEQYKKILKNRLT